MTHEQQEDLTRTLASALWRSAFSPYCRALDHWLAAEAMVTEALRAAPATRDADAAAAESPAWSLGSPAFPAETVRELAQCFWENSARSTALTLDIWLAAERHVLAMCRAVLAGRDPSGSFSAEDYWRRIRDHADRLWRAQGRPSHRDLETWLQAEADILARAAAGSNTALALPAASDGGDPAEGESVRRPLALTMLEEDGAKAAPPWLPTLEAKRGAQPNG